MERIKQLWEQSFLCFLWLRILDLAQASFVFRPGKMKERGQDVNFYYFRSIYHQVLRAWNRLCDRGYAGIHQWYRTSLFSSLVERLADILRGSRILKTLKKWSGFQSMGQLLILIPVFYIVFDKMIRNLPGIRTIGSVWDELTLLLLFVYCVSRRIYSGGRLEYNRTPMGLPIALFILWGVGHVLIRQINVGIAIEGFRAMFQQMLWYFLFVQLIRERREARFVTTALSGLGLFLGLHACYQYVMRVPMLGNWTDVTESVRTRAYSIVGSPNILGALFVILLPIAFLKIFEEEKMQWKALHMISFGSMFLGLLFTFSRGAWLSFGFVVLIFICLVNARLLIPFSFVGLVFLLTDNPITRRLFNLLSPTYHMSSSKGGRLYRWEAGLRIWERSKSYGVGLGRFGGAVAMNNNLTPFYVDNYYLKTLVEMGYYGIIAMAVFVGWFVLYAMKVINSQKTRMDILRTVCIFSGAVGVLIQNFVENIFEVPAMMVIFFLYIALLDVYRKKDGEKDEIATLSGEQKNIDMGIKRDKIMEERNI